MVGEVYLAADSGDLARQSAELIATAGREALLARGRFSLALTGGHTVQAVYRHLAATAEVEFRRLLGVETDFFWGDERLVPADHPDSNFAMARRLLLEELKVSPGRLHPMVATLADPLLAARTYEKSLRDFFAATLSSAGLPVFDLILLGLGPDGHVASLFPGSAALAERQAWVTGVHPPVLSPVVARVSLTMPVLNQARLVLIMVAGQERVALARRISAGAPGVEDLPAARLCPAGRLVWLLAEES